MPAQGVAVTPENLVLAENAALILSLHRELDVVARELERRHSAIGTTRRGIGPAYEDKVGRRAIRARSTSPTRRRCRPRSIGCSRTTTRFAAASAQAEIDAAVAARAN